MSTLVVLNKPAFSEPCNRCGLCCRLSMCEFGESFLDNHAVPCPALEVEAYGRTSCGLLTHPSRHLRVQWSAPDKVDFDDFWRTQFGQLFTGKCSMPDVEDSDNAAD